MNILNKNIRYKKEVYLYDKMLQYHLIKWKIEGIDQLKGKIKPTEKNRKLKKKSNRGKNK